MVSKVDPPDNLNFLIRQLGLPIMGFTLRSEGCVIDITSLSCVMTACYIKSNRNGHEISLVVANFFSTSKKYCPNNFFKALFIVFGLPIMVLAALSNMELELLVSPVLNISVPIDKQKIPDGILLSR